MKKAILLMIGLMIALVGCGQDTSKNNTGKNEYSMNENLKEEPDEVINETVAEEITPPSYYLDTWENDGSIEVTYNEELKQFEIMHLDAEGLARVVRTTSAGHRPAVEKWNEVVESHKKISSLMEEEYSVAIKHPTGTGYLLIVQGGEVVYDFVNE